MLTQNRNHQQTASILGSCQHSHQRRLWLLLSATIVTILLICTGTWFFRDNLASITLQNLVPQHTSIDNQDSFSFNGLKISPKLDQIHLERAALHRGARQISAENIQLTTGGLAALRSHWPMWEMKIERLAIGVTPEDFNNSLTQGMKNDYAGSPGDSPVEGSSPPMGSHELPHIGDIAEKLSQLILTIPRLLGSITIGEVVISGLSHNMPLASTSTSTSTSASASASASADIGADAGSGPSITSHYQPAPPLILENLRITMPSAQSTGVRSEPHHTGTISAKWRGQDFMCDLALQESEEDSALPGLDSTDSRHASHASHAPRSTGHVLSIACPTPIEFELSASKNASIKIAFTEAALMVPGEKAPRIQLEIPNLVIVLTSNILPASTPPANSAMSNTATTPAQTGVRYRGDLILELAGDSQSIDSTITFQTTALQPIPEQLPTPAQVHAINEADPQPPTPAGLLALNIQYQHHPSVTVGHIIFTNFPIAAANTIQGGQLEGAIFFNLDHSDGITLEASYHVEARNLAINSPRLCGNTVNGLNLTLQGTIERDQCTGTTAIPYAQISLNGLTAELGAQSTITPTQRRIALTMDTGPQSGETLTSAIPADMLSHLRGTRFVGPWSLKINLDVDLKSPEDMLLLVDLNSSRLQIHPGPGINMNKLQGTYPHTAVTRYGTFQFLLGPDSSHWTPLHQVPPLLRDGVLIQEDGGFHNHGGFSLLHIRGSIIKNIQEKRFARGASTITMQTAKNLFLTRDKNLARKMEELFLAIKLERTLTKEQILELYLNMIEFGPGVFGIQHASHTYFGKQPQWLTPLECAYLISIIPAPGRYQKSFREGTITPNHSERIRRLMALMVERGLLSQPEYESAAPWSPHFSQSKP